MAWVRYGRWARDCGCGATLRFGRYNSIQLTATARDEFDLERYPYVELHFDPSRGTVGLRPTAKRSRYAMRMLWQRSRGEISGRGFCTQFGIHADPGRHHPLTKDEETGMLVSHLEDWEWEGPPEG